MGEGSGIALSYGVNRRHSSDPSLLWLWRRLVATAPIRLLAWEPPYVEGAALEKTKKKKKKKKESQPWRKLFKKKKKERELGKKSLNDSHKFKEIH